MNKIVIGNATEVHLPSLLSQLLELPNDHVSHRVKIAADVALSRLIQVKANIEYTTVIRKPSVPYEMDSGCGGNTLGKTKFILNTSSKFRMVIPRCEIAISFAIKKSQNQLIFQPYPI